MTFQKKINLNLLSLIALHGSNAFLPLLIFPRCLLVLGSNKYADIVVGESIMFIAYAISLYSFEINGIKKVMENEKKNFSLIFQTRIILLIFCLLIILLLSFLDIVEGLTATLWLLFPVAYIFQNNYFYLAKEDNFNLALRVLPGKILSVIFVFACINPNSPPWSIPLIIGICYTTSGIFAFFYLIKKYNIFISPISLVEFRNTLNINKDVFLGSFSVLFMKDVNVLILDSFSFSNNNIASYSIAEKITKAFQAAIRPLNQFYFKKGVSLLERHNKPNRSILNKLLQFIYPQLSVIIILTLASILALSFFQADLNLSFQFKSVALLLSIMLPTTIVGLCNYVFGSLGLNHLSKSKALTISIIFSSLISLIIIVVLTFYLGVIGTAIAFLVSELVLLVMIINKYITEN